MFVCNVEIFECLVKMNENQWIYDNIMSEEVNMNEQNQDKASVNEEHIDYFNVFNTS